jgi:FdhD protein
MTLGASPELLVLGYLLNQRLITQVAEVESITVDWEVGAAAVKTHNGIADIEQKTARRVVTTGCGQGTVFGDLMEEIDSIQLRSDVRLSEAGLHSLLDAVRRHETIYKSAGAVHGCALAAINGDNAEILHFVEDVGRHNAVDAIAGLMWLNDIDGSDKVFYTTGRLTSEMVIKAAQMRIPFLVSRSGLTQMGHDVAQRTGITMLGRAVNKHYLLFTGRERFVKPISRTLTA